MAMRRRLLVALRPRPRAPRRAPARPLSSLLSDAEAAAYAEDGYVVPSWRLPDAELASCRRALDALLADNPSVPPELLVNAHLAAGEGGGGESGEDVAMGVRGRAELMRLATLEPLVNLVAAALRTDHLILWACQVFCKPPREGKSVPFHQDGLYWPIEPLRACSAWVALDRSDAENGALQVYTPCVPRARAAHHHLAIIFRNDQRRALAREK